MYTLQKKLFLVVITAALGAFAFVAPASAGLFQNHNETFLRDEN